MSISNNNNNNNYNSNNQKEPLLPPPELLRRYDEVYKGLSNELLDLVKKEQKHRHKIQERYLMQFRIGQIAGIVFLSYIFYAIFDFLKMGHTGIAYSLLLLLSLILLMSIYQYKSNKVRVLPKKVIQKRVPQQQRRYARSNGNNSR
ncbi:MAG: DUF2335 domain-containing protein [Rickettsiales bacterium]|jgi:uncharacterized membrane protein|nr:DUF2335 domain-containing protein [Rickettsiales bacterium]